MTQGTERIRFTVQQVPPIILEHNSDEYVFLAIGPQYERVMWRRVEGFAQTGETIFTTQYRWQIKEPPLATLAVDAGELKELEAFVALRREVDRTEKAFFRCGGVNADTRGKQAEDAQKTLAAFMWSESMQAKIAAWHEETGNKKDYKDVPWQAWKFWNSKEKYRRMFQKEDPTTGALVHYLQTDRALQDSLVVEQKQARAEIQEARIEAAKIRRLAEAEAQQTRDQAIETLSIPELKARLEKLTKVGSKAETSTQKSQRATT